MRDEMYFRKHGITKEQWQKIEPLYRGAIGRCKYPSPRNSKCYIDAGIKFNLSEKEFYELWVKYGADSMKKPSLHRLDIKDHYDMMNCQIIEWEDHVKIHSDRKKSNKPKPPKKDIPEELRAYLSYIGKLGGSKKSEKKAISSRQNINIALKRS